MSTQLITTTPRVVTTSWFVIAFFGAAIIAVAVFASLYGNVTLTDLLIGS